MKSLYSEVNGDGHNNSSQADPINQGESIRIKLPKLVMTKFQGNHLDWLRFWNQFETEIDKSKLSPVSKFCYLKEMLIPRVRILIDGLPLNEIGYGRAKDILMQKYGKVSEVVNAHIQEIIAFPTIYQISSS